MKKLTILVSSKVKNAELAGVIESEAKTAGFDTNLINLVDLDLPLYTSVEETNGIPEKAKILTEDLANSDSMVVISPEYNGLIAPVLNNAIAWMSVGGSDWRRAFNGKPCLIATHSGGPGARALVSMRIQLSYIGANVIGREIACNDSKAPNPESIRECLKFLQ